MDPENYTEAGLVLLQHLDEVRIHQKITWGRNKYKVKTVDGEPLFILKEKNSAAAMFGEASVRRFHMEAVDSKGEEAFTLRRPTVFTSDKVEVSMGEQVVCTVRRVFTFLKPLFSVNDENDYSVLRIKGGYNEYEFQTLDKAAIGYISKKFFTYTDNYKIQFPVDLEVRYKVATIAACILIDYIFHETNA